MLSQMAAVENVTIGTPEVEIEYVVRYVDAIEIPLAEIKYIPVDEWIDPRDNLPWI